MFRSYWNLRVYSLIQCRHQWRTNYTEYSSDISSTVTELSLSRLSISFSCPESIIFRIPFEVKAMTLLLHQNFYHWKNSKITVLLASLIARTMRIFHLSLHLVLWQQRLQRSYDMGFLSSLWIIQVILKVTKALSRSIIDALSKVDLGVPSLLLLFSFVYKTFRHYLLLTILCMHIQKLKFSETWLPSCCFENV